MFNLEYLSAIRAAEMDALVPLIPKGAKVLEFGAGTGEQAKMLSERGFDVVAIDLVSSGYAGERLFPVTDYDGRHIPLPDQSVDVIFSSNVLEHVKDLEAVFAEFRRILKPEGIEVHAMPTPAWRLWSTMIGIPTAVEWAAMMIPHALRPPVGQSRTQALIRDAKMLVTAALPTAHGTAAEGISELWTFSPRAWAKVFAKNGHEIVEEHPVGLFYTAHMFLGRRLSFAARRKLSKYLGSAAHIYIARPVPKTRGRHQ